MDYEQLAARAAKPRPIRDWTARWELLTPLGSVNGSVRERIERFCESKRISPEALLALDTKLRIGRGGEVLLAWAGRNPAGRVTAIKYRPLNGSSHDSLAEAPSVWLRPIVVGKLDALEWLVAEGETDAARLLDLVGSNAAVMALPAGALTFKREWADLIPRGATVYLCHDADEDGDRGAEKAARVLGGNTVRVRPPIKGGDWCDWEGQPEEFAELVRAARGSGVELRVVVAEDFAAVEEMGAGALVGSEDAALIPENADVMFYGDGGAGKTTLCIDLACHLAAGSAWLGIPVPRAARVLLVENEGPRPRYRGKLRQKLAAWTGSPLEGRLQVFETPWGKLSLADPGHRRALANTIAEEGFEVVIIGPLSRSGMNEAGTLQDVNAFMQLVGEVREQAGRHVAVVFVHHENKGGQVSGAWEGAGDTLFHVQAQGHGKVRLHVQKARWSSEHHKTTLHLLWTEGEGFAVEDRPELDDATLAEQIVAAIGADPGASWSKIEKATPGVARERRMKVRDRLFADGLIVNVLRDEALAYCPERRPSCLHLGSDPTIRHLLPARGADGEQTAPARVTGGNLQLLPAPRPIGEQGVGADLASPPNESEGGL